MKYLFSILSVLLLACNNAGSAPGSDSAAAPKEDGHLYLRTYMWTGMYGSNLDISWIYLSDDGKIVRNPVHGVNPVDWAKEGQDNAKNVGRYEEKDGKLAITWSNGKTDSWSIERKGGEVTIIDGGIISEPDAMPANYRIEGQYAASTVLPNVANSQTLVFQKDGSFTMSNLGTVTTPDVAKAAQNDSKGTYDISGNTLTFQFADGSVKKSTICIWDMDGERSLVINGRYYPQEK